MFCIEKVSLTALAGMGGVYRRLPSFDFLESTIAEIFGIWEKQATMATLASSRLPRAPKIYSRREANVSNKQAHGGRAAECISKIGLLSIVSHPTNKL